MATEILIIGLGFVGTYVRNLCISEQIKSEATTTTGRDKSIKFLFSQDLDKAAYKYLPEAKYILITFPLKSGSPKIFIDCYRATHSTVPNIILLGSTGSFKSNILWHDRNGPLDSSDERIKTENELLALGGCALNLVGLWGGSRHPRNWISRVAPSKSSLELKGSLHLIHGHDAARLVVAVFNSFTTGTSI
jgi:hypothetical protein